MGTQRGLFWAGERTLQCADDVLLSYILETCMILSTNATPTIIKFNAIK